MGRKRGEKIARVAPSVLTARVYVSWCSFTNFEEMKIGRDRKHPKRADTFINYYDGDGDSHIHKSEWGAKHDL